MKRHGRVFALTSGAAALAFAGALACSTPTQPAKEIGKAEVAVKSAEQDNQTQQAAGLEMTMAREKLERAKTAMRDGDREKAERLAEEAEVDAELARVKAESQSAQSAALELERSIQSLRGEAQRGASMPQ
jgi:Domain of unknown function (DUF4398)